jgi:hypothetical protein
MFNYQRDKLRDNLSAISPILFRRFGQVGASVSAIIDIAFPRSTRQVMILPSCPCGCPPSQSFPNSISEDNFPSIIIPPEMQIADAVDVNQYLSDFLAKASQNWDDLTVLSNQTTCQKCSSVLSSVSAAFLVPPPLLFFEVPAAGSPFSVSPSLYIKVPSVHRDISYRLAAMIYIGGYHFSCRLIIGDGAVWKHDGQVNNGRPCPDVHIPRFPSFPQFLPEISFLGIRAAHFYIYSRVDE